MVIIVPIYEEEIAGIYYNTAAVIDADGKYLANTARITFPRQSGFWEKSISVRNLATRHSNGLCTDGVYICYDRHFPEGARALGLNGAEIVFQSVGNCGRLSEYLWKLEQPAHAVANGYFVGAINRVGHEQPWDIGEFYGQSYFCDPRGQIIAQAPRDEDAVVVADLDLDLIREVRNTWQFFRDRRRIVIRRSLPTKKSQVPGPKPQVSVKGLRLESWDPETWDPRLGTCVLRRR